MNFEKYREIQERCRQKGAKLIAVGKTKPSTDLMALYEQGQRAFGENKVQELCAKAEELPKDFEWHMIGHLQRNKVKYIAPFVSLIHSVDSLRLLKEIDKQAAKNNRNLKILLQVHIAREETKFGMDEQELMEAVQFAVKECGNVTISGLMGMATNTDDEDRVRSEFSYLKSLFDQLKSNELKDNADFCEISMGMSGDYELALEEGSTMIRVGSLIFGERNYDNPAAKMSN